MILPMIQTVKGTDSESTIECGFNRVHEHKYEIDTTGFVSDTWSVEIRFTEKIKLFRDHDYTWKDLSQTRISNWYSPKVLKLENGLIVQANQQNGVWSVDGGRPEILVWTSSPKESGPLADYQGSGNKKTIRYAKQPRDLTSKPALLSSWKYGVEISRSKVPFSGIVCFTDHCDFDTLENLKVQRAFFKKHGVVTTKGFFLDHYSKRETNASWERNSEELKLWIHDGHELAFHSLSQSIKSMEASIDRFRNFKSPISGIKTWIDHGFQPYNISMTSVFPVSLREYSVPFDRNGIRIFWNYIDSGTAMPGVINQINPRHFTLSRCWKGLKVNHFKKRASFMLRCILLHYYGGGEKSGTYKELARRGKKNNSSGNIKSIWLFMKAIIDVVFTVMKLILSWPRSFRTPFPLAKYGTLFFRQKMVDKEVTVFQTVELVDLKRALSIENLDTLVKECGVIIGHTYFSVPFNYHDGRLIEEDGSVNGQVDKNFAYISHLMAEKKLWNPTLMELEEYLSKLKSLRYDCSPDGGIYVDSDDGYFSRKIV